MKGYGLFELLVVLSIISLLSLFAVPSLQHLYFATKTATQVNQFVRILTFARTQAIISSTPCMVCPMETNRLQCGRDWSEGMNVFETRNGSTVLIKQLQNPTGSTITWNRSGNQIIFGMQGFLQSQNGSFSYRMAGNTVITKKIILSSTGRIRVE